MPFFEKIPGQAEDRAGPPVYAPPREDPIFEIFFQGDFDRFFEFPLEKIQIFKLFFPENFSPPRDSKMRGKNSKKRPFFQKKALLARFGRKGHFSLKKGLFSWKTALFSLFRRFRPNPPTTPFWPLFPPIRPPGWHLPTGNCWLVLAVGSLANPPPIMWAELALQACTHRSTKVDTTLCVWRSCTIPYSWRVDLRVYTFIGDELIDVASLMCGGACQSSHRLAQAMLLVTILFWGPRYRAPRRHYDNNHRPIRFESLTRSWVYEG